MLDNLTPDFPLQDKVGHFTDLLVKSDNFILRELISRIFRAVVGSFAALGDCLFNIGLTVVKTPLTIGRVTLLTVTLGYVNLGGNSVGITNLLFHVAQIALYAGIVFLNPILSIISPNWGYKQKANPIINPQPNGSLLPPATSTTSRPPSPVGLILAEAPIQSASSPSAGSPLSAAAAPAIAAASDAAADSLLGNVDVSHLLGGTTPLPTSLQVVVPPSGALSLDEVLNNGSNLSSDPSLVAGYVPPPIPPSIIIVPDLLPPASDFLSPIVFATLSSASSSAAAAAAAASSIPFSVESVASASPAVTPAPASAAPANLGASSSGDYLGPFLACQPNVGGNVLPRSDGRGLADSVDSLLNTNVNGPRSDLSRSVSELETKIKASKNFSDFQTSWTAFFHQFKLRDEQYTHIELNFLFEPFEKLWTSVSSDASNELRLKFEGEMEEVRKFKTGMINVHSQPISQEEQEKLQGNLQTIEEHDRVGQGPVNAILSEESDDEREEEQG